MSLFGLSRFDVQSVLSIIALGPDAVREFLAIDDDAGQRAFAVKWFGKDNPTAAEARKVGLDRMVATGTGGNV